MSKSLPISFRLPSEAKHALEQAAKDDHRSVSSLLEKVVVEWLRGNADFGKPEGKKKGTAGIDASE